MGGCWSTTTPSSSPTICALLLEAGAADDVGTLTGQVRFMSRPDVINTAGLGMDKLGVAWDRLAGAPAVDGGEVEEVFGASACVALYRRAMLNAIGGFDPALLRLHGGRRRGVARPHGRLARAVRARPRSPTTTARPPRASRPPFKYHLVGRNRIRMIARNATTGQLIRWGWAMVALRPRLRDASSP